MKKVLCLFLLLVPFLGAIRASSVMRQRQLLPVSDEKLAFTKMLSDDVEESAIVAQEHRTLEELLAGVDLSMSHAIPRATPGLSGNQVPSSAPSTILVRSSLPSVRTDCSGRNNTFETIVSVDFQGDPDLLTAEDEVALEDLFLVTYNDLATNECDDQFTILANVHLVSIVDSESRRRLMAPLDPNIRRIRRFSVFFNVVYTCKNCPRGSNVFGNDAARRQLMLTDAVNHVISGASDQQQKREEELDEHGRSLEECFCDVESSFHEPPTAEVFASAYEAAIQDALIPGIFNVTRVLQQVTLNVDKSTYFVGDTIHVLLTGDLTELTSSNLLSIFPEDVTDYSLGSSIMSTFLGSEGATTGSVSLRVTFENEGRFKMVLLSEGELPINLDESPGFVLIGNARLHPIVVDKLSYIVGQYITAEVTGDLATLTGNDRLYIFPDDESNYFYGSIASTPLGEGSGNVFGAIFSIRVAFLDSGLYKMVILLEDDLPIALGESLGFELVGSPGPNTLTVDRTSYSFGDTITATLTRNPSDGLAASDVLHVFPDDVTDYSEGSSIASKLLVDSDISSGTVSLFVDFFDAGRFKIVILLQGTLIVLNESPAFDLILLG